MASFISAIDHMKAIHSEVFPVLLLLSSQTALMHSCFVVQVPAIPWRDGSVSEPDTYLCDLHTMSRIQIQHE